MKPAVIVQIFRRTGPWFTSRGWAFIGGFIAGLAFVSTFILQWK